MLIFFIFFVCVWVCCFFSLSLFLRLQQILSISRHVYPSNGHERDVVHSHSQSQQRASQSSIIVSRGVTRINTNRIAMLFYFRTRRCIFIARPRISVHFLVYSVSQYPLDGPLPLSCPCFILHGINVQYHMVVLASYRYRRKKNHATAVFFVSFIIYIIYT